MERRKEASLLVLLAEDSQLGCLQLGLLAIGGEKKKWRGKSKEAELERLAEAASR